MSLSVRQETMEKQKIIQITNKIYRLTLFFPKKEPLRYKIRERADNILGDFTELDSLESYFEERNINNENINNNKKRKQDLIFNLKTELEILKSYFNIAKWQNWVSYFDILEIEGEYDKLNQTLSYFESEYGFKQKSLLESKSKQPKQEDNYQKEQKISVEEQEQQIIAKNLISINEIIKNKKNLLVSNNLKTNANQEESGYKKDINNINQTDGKSNLSPRKKKILEILQEKEQVQVWEINKIMPDVSKRTLRRDFAELLAQGLVQRIGEKNNTFYKIKK